METNNQPKKRLFIPALAYCLLLPVYLELVLHLFVYKGLSARIAYPLLFALTAGLVIFALCSLLPHKAGGVVLCVLTGILVLYFEVQFVYNSIFGEFMSLWQVTFGAEAITNFWYQLLYGIWKALWKILVLLLPLPLVIVLVCKNWLNLQRLKWYLPALAVVLALGLHFGAVGIMRLNDTNAFSVWDLYTNANTATEISVRNIGLLSTTRLEAMHILNPAPVEEEAPAVVYPEPHAPVEIVESEYDKFNMMNIDFSELAGQTDSVRLKNLDAYFQGVEPTEKHEYTGFLKDYNLITICAESFSPAFITKELTPALYELTTHGFIFENFYGSFGSNTTNGEYTFCMGLYPDLSRSKSTASFYASQVNYLPFCLGNAMKADGAEAWAYHNYTGEYYSRYLTHPNMGYTFQSATDGLDLTLSWPSSDLEMVQESVGDYLGDGQRFCTYYMTFSGHYQYDWDNPMSAKNRDKVQDLPYSDTVKAYIACNLELEAALQELLDQLDAAGVRDKTCIVLTNDHYPYGLTDAEYSELLGHPVEPTFEKFRNSFICYVPDMEVTVDTYCSTVDILPTLLNLFGLQYDSRLLMGRDVLSPQATGVAVLSDQSFIGKDFSFDTSTGKATYFAPQTPELEAALTDTQERIALEFQISMDMLGNDYYRHAVQHYGVDQETVDDLPPQEELPHNPTVYPEGSAGSAPPEVLKQYPFTDIPSDITLAALDYVYDNGYMDPMSDTKFGFDAPCTDAELFDVLYRICGKPDVGGVTSVWLGSDRHMTGKYAPATYWARENGLWSPYIWYLDSFTTLSRREAAVTLYRFARIQGYDVSVDTDRALGYADQFYNLYGEELIALYWCYKNNIMRGTGTVESSFELANQEMSRYYVVSAVYNFYLYLVEAE